MQELKDSIHIKVSPEKVYTWLLNLDKHYLEWHPDHTVARFTKGDTMESGAELYVEEKLHGSMHKMTMRCTKVEPNRLIEYQVLFPMSLICSQGTFSIESDNGGSMLTATLTFRFPRLFKMFAKKQMEQFVQHMREEGVNLKKILEKSN